MPADCHKLPAGKRLAVAGVWAAKVVPVAAGAVGDQHLARDRAQRHGAPTLAHAAAAGCAAGCETHAATCVCNVTRVEAAARYHLFAKHEVSAAVSEAKAVLREGKMLKRVAGPEEARWQSGALQGALAELRVEYELAMKLATLNYAMRAADFRATITALFLPSPVEQIGRAHV